MSSRRRRSQPKESLTVFLDQGLGRYDVAEAVRNAGFACLPAHEVYPEAGHTPVDDDVWIQRCADEGWVALTKDTAILRHHKSSLVGETLRVFAFDSAQLTGAQMAERFSKHALGIERRCHKPGPNVYVLHAHTIELRWPSEG